MREILLPVSRCSKYIEKKIVCRNNSRLLRSVYREVDWQPLQHWKKWKYSNRHICF